MSEKINIIPILKAHNETLEGWDNLVFYFIPLIIAIAIIISPFSFILKGTVIDSLILIMSISIPFLISVLALMYNIGQSITNSSDANKKSKLELVEEVSHAIVFTSFISFITVIILGISLMVDNLPLNELFMINIGLFNNISSLIVFYLLGIIILTTILILKRTYLLVSSTFELKKE